MRHTSTTAQARPTTFAAFNSLNYRYFWAGSLVAIMGWQIQFLAQAWLVYRLTDSPFLLGMVGFFTGLPSVILAPFGGVLADRMDRLRLLKLTQVALALQVFALATLTATGLVQIWHIFLLATVSGIVQAFDQPSRQSLVPGLVERHQLQSAIALSSMTWQFSRIVGPAVAGVTVALAGEAACFYVTAAGFLVMVLALTRIRLEHANSSRGGGNVWQNLIEGFRFIVHTPLFATIIAITFMDSIFGMSYVTLMPVFARDILGVGAQGLGFLMTASGVGALVGALTVASLGGFRHRGWLLIYGLGGFSLFLIAFALSSWFQLSLVLLGGMGLQSALYMVTANTTLQSEVPDALRGRVMSIYGLTWSLSPLGGTLAGAVAQVWGAPVAVGLGGGIVLASALFIALFVPRVRRLA